MDEDRGQGGRGDASNPRRSAQSRRAGGAEPLDHLWLRHIADSAQLLRFAPSPAATWVDLGTGAGFPGLIVAVLHKGPVTLVEERRLRADFLHRAAESLGVAAEIVAGKVERLPRRPFDVISARAFAPLSKLLDLAAPFADKSTRWVLPKGKSAAEELEASHASWQGMFELVPSVTDSEAAIIVAEGVTPRKKRR